MSTERRPSYPNEKPEDKNRENPDDVLDQMKREYKRRYRPVRLYVTSSEREHITPPTDEDITRLAAALITILSNAELAGKFREDTKQLLGDAEKIKKARAQLTPLTPEEVESQDGDSAINLVNTERTMSGKINLVEKLQPEQLDTLRQRYPDFEAVITGLSKRPTRKEKAQRRILAIYQRRGEDESRP